MEVLSGNQNEVDLKQYFAKRKKLAWFILFFIILASTSVILTTGQLKNDERILQNNQPAQPDTAGWKTYRNEEYGFEFKYPGDWELSEYDSKGWVVRVVNPAYPGKPDTGVPIERFSVTLDNLKCEGQPFQAGDKTVKDSGWEVGYAELPVRSLCMDLNVGKLSINLNPFEESSVPIFNQILSTFKFIP